MCWRCRTQTFDYVIADQVLEHVAGPPQKAFDECHRVLRPGGWVVHTTCFINPIHEAPADYWRFTPEGLRQLCQGYARVIECAGWGNPYAWLAVWLGLRFEGVPEASWHPLHRLAVGQNSDWPISTWVIAER